ncbi:hypothetical protein LOTGIDRAFT_106479, partial [Lottia gigantea]
IFQAPPNVVTSEQRHAAEAIILAFRKTKLPYNTCRYILENTKSDYVLFQTATTLKEAIIREWTLLSPEDIESLRSFLLRYITKHISLQSYVREQILQTVAVILKRGTLDSKGTGCDNMFTDVTSLIGSGNVTMQLVACSMLTSLLNEYSSSSRTSNTGFTWEFHTKCKRAFETNNLKKVFLFCLQVLNEIDAQPSPLTREATAVLNRVLSITEQVLSWEFSPKSLLRRRVGLFETNNYVTLKPNEAWRDTLLDRNILQLFFKIHEKARFNSEMAHHSIQCIGQLASLNGVIFTNDESRKQYLQSFLDGFLHLLGSIELQDFENLGVATIFKNIFMMFPIKIFMALPETHFQACVDHMTRLTCHMGRLAALEEALHKDDCIYMDGYEKMLETWMQLTLEINQLPEGSLKPQATEVFHSYLQCHISPPEGLRSQVGHVDSGIDDEELGELDEDDRDKFSDQLCCIGALARIIPEHSIPLLAKVLEERVSRLHGQLQRLQQHRDTSGTLNASFDTSILNILHEDLHWLVLVAAHVLTEEAEGETPMIPSNIMQYSITTSQTIDLHTTLKVLASPGERVEDIPGSQSTDNVVRLISAVFRLCEVETRAVNAKLTDCVSPQVGSTCMWFLRRWVLSYLLPDENYYSQMSMALQSAFGRDTDGAQWVIAFLIQKIISNITTWSSEEQLVEDSLKVLVALLKNGSKAVYVVKCNLLWDLARLEANNGPPLSLLSSISRRLLLKALVLAGSAFKDPPVKEEFWKIILQSIQERFYGLICGENFVKTFHNVEVQESVCCLLESLLGIAQGTRVDNMERLFLYLSPFLAESVKLIEVYHNYESIISLILELYSEVVQRHLCYLGESNCKKLYDLCLSAIQMYSKHNTGKRIVDASEDEETKYRDILTVMELLTNLLSKDFIDFGPAEETPSNSQVEGADVVMYGLNIVIPIMSLELLKFPTLCSQYFKLLTFLSDVHPEKFTTLPENLFKSLVTSIEHGLTAFGSDITKMCLEIITSLASHVFDSNFTGSTLHTAMSHFLKIVFHMLLLESFDMDLIETASTALFCLICCHQDQYKELVNQLLQSQLEDQYKQRLLVAFNNLTPSTLTMTINRQSKIAFMHNFDQFLVNVRGFLCVK